MSDNEEDWTAQDAKKWEEELNDWMSEKKCVRCGSNKVPMKLRGRPYMPYVHWHEKKSEELGWDTLRLLGCNVRATDKPKEEVCADCEGKT